MDLKNKKILGIPLILAGIVLMIAVGGMAALLTYFGSVVTTVSVDQGLKLDGEAWDTPVVKSFNTTSAEAKTFLTEHELVSTASVDVVVDFNLTCTADDPNSCDEINHTIVDYFNNAGHDFNSYEVPVCDKNISSLNNIDTDDIVYCVASGTYTGDVTITNTGVKVYSLEGQGDAIIKGTVSITSNDVVFSGFKVEVDGDKSGIHITSNNVEISYNNIINTEHAGDNSFEAWGEGKAISDSGSGTGRKYHNNYMEGFKWGTYANAQLERFEYNTVIGARNGIVHAGGSPLEINNNVFKYVHRGISHTDGSPVVAEGNRISLYDDWEVQGSRHISENAGTPNVNANNNYFSNPSEIQVRNKANIVSGDVKVSFSEITELLVPSEESKMFAVLIDVPTHTHPQTYTFKTVVDLI